MDASIAVFGLRAALFSFCDFGCSVLKWMLFYAKIKVQLAKVI